MATDNKQLPAAGAGAAATVQKYEMGQAEYGRGIMPRSFEEVEKIGRVMSASGFFDDAKSESQAVAKILYGMEIGLSPLRALTAIYFVKGQAKMWAVDIANAIANHPRYGYEVLQLNDDLATVQITYDGKPKGDPVKFTYDQAVAMKVTHKTPWQVDRQMMLFYKAIRRAKDLYAQDVFALSVGAMEDADDPIEAISVRSAVSAHAEVIANERDAEAAERNKKRDEAIDVLYGPTGDEEEKPKATVVDQLEAATSVGAAIGDKALEAAAAKSVEVMKSATTTASGRISAADKGKFVMAAGKAKVDPVKFAKEKYGKTPSELTGDEFAAAMKELEVVEQ